MQTNKSYKILTELRGQFLMKWPGWLHLKQMYPRGSGPGGIPLPLTNLDESYPSVDWWMAVEILSSSDKSDLDRSDVIMSIGILVVSCYITRVKQSKRYYVVKQRHQNEISNTYSQNWIRRPEVLIHLTWLLSQRNPRDNDRAVLGNESILGSKD